MLFKNLTHLAVAAAAIWGAHAAPVSSKRPEQVSSKHVVSTTHASPAHVTAQPAKHVTSLSSKHVAHVSSTHAAPAHVTALPAKHVTSESSKHVTSVSSKHATSVKHATPLPSNHVAIKHEITPSVAALDATEPRFIIYQDLVSSEANGFPTPDDLKGFNVLNLAFHLVNGPTDMALAWQNLGPDGRTALKAQYSAAGIKVMAAVFGGTETPTTNNVDPVQMADNIQFFVTQNELDGVEIDYEDFAAISNDQTAAVAWIVTFTQSLRNALPVGQYLVSHAPIAPWFSPGGPYLSVDQQVGSLIDYYSIQFYNQGTTEYVDCNGLFTQSSSAHPKSSVFEIAAAGIPLSKIVVGKPASTTDAGQGNMDPGALGQCLPAAQAQGWSAGLMVFQFPRGNAAWISSARGSAFPV